MAFFSAPLVKEDSPDEQEMQDFEHRSFNLKNVVLFIDLHRVSK